MKGNDGRGLGASFRHAFDGIRHVVCTQRNARIHLAVALGAIMMGLYVGLARVEWAVVALTIGAVLAAEWFNTVAEVTIDLCTTEPHPLAKTAKDVAAGAVLVAAIAAVLVGFLVLLVPFVQKVLSQLYG